MMTYKVDVTFTLIFGGNSLKILLILRFDDIFMGRNVRTAELFSGCRRRFGMDAEMSR